jgi:hypothetical protein
MSFEESTDWQQDLDFGSVLQKPNSAIESFQAVTFAFLI